MKKLKKPILEFIPVFLGVILALLFNNINEGRIQRNKIDGLLEKIELGMIKNSQSLNKQLDQNQRVVDSLKYYQNEDDLRITDILNRSQGIRYIQFDLAAWNVLKSSELLVEVDYEIVSLLYLLNESIDNEEDIDFPSVARDAETKELLIGNLEDYNSSTRHRLVLTQRIQKLLSEKD